MSTRTILLALLAILGLAALADAPELDEVLADAWAASPHLGICPEGNPGGSMASAAVVTRASPSDARR